MISLLSSLFISGNAPKTATQIALTILRVVAGVVMIHNGLDKLADIEGFAEAYVEVIGLPFPIFFSYVAGLTETIGAPLLALGLFTRPAALGLTSTMLVAMYHHILVAGLSIPFLELSVLYGAVFAFFTVYGAGDYSLDSLIAKVMGWGQSVPAPGEPMPAVQSEPQPAVPVTGWGSYLTKTK
ncbi:MAG: DoxX family protein [Pseudanabaenaceae cyanobacterium]